MRRPVNLSGLAGLASLLSLGCVASSADQEFEDFEIDTSGPEPVFSWDGPDAVFISVTGSDGIDTLVCDEGGASGLLYYFAWCPGGAEEGVVESDELSCMSSPWTYGDAAPGADQGDSDSFYSRALDKGHPSYCVELLAWGASGEPDTHSVIPFEL